MDNEYNRIAKEERDLQQALKIDAILEEVAKLTKLIAHSTRETRRVRQDLRNLENLRPLKSAVEDDDVEETPEEPVTETPVVEQKEPIATEE